jgi:hypothetical protein
MTLTMYDAITVPNIPSNASYVAGYVGGLWPTYPTLVKQFPKATLLSIAINSSENAECLDVETGDATIADIPAWVKRQEANDVSRPVIYSSVGNMNSILSTLSANNISRQSVRLWSAHYGQGNHICGPSSCGQIRTDMDGTQWTDNANGKSLDQSALNANFFATSVKAPAAPTEVLSGMPVITLNMKDSDLPFQYITRAQAIMNAVFGQKLTVDGNYGPASQAAVKAVQKSANLTQDGIIGIATWKVLYLGQ